ncbi:MAG: chemotaxis protein CheZ [Phenylobacterium sp.]|jgi:chemotaxis protein CheZ
MSVISVPNINMEQARMLVVHLEKGDQDAADLLLASLETKETDSLFSGIGKMTRQLHDSLTNFQLDSRIANLANEDIPDAQERLSYVINLTEQAANTTMDAIDTGLPLADKLCNDLAAIKPVWTRLMSRKLDVGEFKSLCHKVDDFVEYAEQDTAQLHILLNEILMAQGFQDLTGQVIRRVIELVREVEESLVHLLSVFGAAEMSEDEKHQVDEAHLAEGPIMNAEERDDVVSGQDDVDDLLSSLGF